MGMGDDLMASGEARELRRADFNRRRVKILRRKGQYRWSEVWANNPNIARPEEAGDFLELDENAGRRYRASETRERRFWTDVGPLTHPQLRGDLYFTEAEHEFGERAHAEGAIVIEPNLKLQATTNKDWGFDNFQEVVDRAPKLPWLQMGSYAARRLNNVRFVETPSFRHAAAVLGHAAAAVLPEGGLHHAAAIVNTPAVVIFGGYVSPAQTGYVEHVNLFAADQPCGWRIPCLHCRAAMAAIAPAHVIIALDGLLRPRAARDVPSGQNWTFPQNRSQEHAR